MRLPVKKILGIVLLTAGLLMPSYVYAQEPSQGEKTSAAKGEAPAAAPDLADIVPLSVELTRRLAALKKGINTGIDISAAEKKYNGIEANLDKPADKLQRLKDSEDSNYNKLVELKKIIEQENALFEKTSNPVREEIRRIGAWREEWQAEKKRWNEWQSSLLKEEKQDRLISTFEKANDTIDKAFNLVLSRLEAMLSIQEKAGNIHARINALVAELDGLILEARRDLVLKASPPMFSSQYYSQFKNRELWYLVQKGLQEISWPGSRFVDQQGWTILIQAFLSLLVIIGVYRNRRVLNESKRWRFMAARPFSIGFFLGTMAAEVIYAYEGAPGICEAVNGMVVGISFARLMGVLAEAPWKRRFVYGVMGVLIIARITDVASLPLPLFRLFTLFIALAGVLLCLRWAGESARQKESVFYAWSLRMAAILFAVIIIAELWGKKVAASYLFVSLIDTIATALAFTLITYMINGGLEWLFRTSPLRRVSVWPGDNIDTLIQRVARFIDIAIWGLVFIPAILMIWGVYDNLDGATKGVLALGFNLGSQRINIGLLLVSAGILYASFIASWILRKLFVDEVLVRQRMEKGVRHSIGRLLHYVLIFVGFLIAISTLGFDLSKFTIMLGALGVGIGFGLQGIVNNFVSGLILLFERPVRVGDTVEISGKWAEIKRIGIRATTVQTLDHADLIIPNADLINNEVTNWTLSNRLVRLIIPVGVAYGSDVPLVMEILAACAKDHDMVSSYRSPQVLFLSFGESSLDFELRVWVTDADHRLEVKSDLHQKIDRKFREANIEIAFPQRDLHLRSVDETVTLRPLETTK